MSEVQAALVWCPFPDADSARSLAAQLLDERLIACANILPPIESMFTWNGKVATGKETAVLFKTTCDRLDMLIARLGECHPYDTPAIAGWCCDSSHPQTLDWLSNAVAQRN